MHPRTKWQIIFHIVRDLERLSYTLGNLYPSIFALWTRELEPWLLKENTPSFSILTVLHQRVLAKLACPQGDSGGTDMWQVDWFHLTSL